MSEINQNNKFQNELSKEEVITVIKNDLGTTEFKLHDYTIKPASDNPMGFLGVLLKIEANITVSNHNNKLSYFVKKMPTEVPQHLDYALKTKAFYKEIEMYKTLFVDLKNAQKERKDPIKWLPEYYYSRGTEIFVMEDLSARGYYMLPERTTMDEEHVKATLKAAAAMHAASIVYEEKFNRNKVGTLSPTFERSEGDKVTIGDVYSHLTFETEAHDSVDHPGYQFYEAGIKSHLPVIDLLPGYTNAEREKIKSALTDKLRRIRPLVKPSDRFKNVFIHGDLWANNILFRKGKSGKVENAVLIDFQLGRYGPPAHDIMMLLHLVQNNDFRQKKQLEMLKYFYEIFSEELSKNDLDAEKILPWTVFLESADYYDELGAASAVLYFQLILMPSDITSKFLSSPELFHQNMLVDRSEMVKECFLKDEISRSRLIDAFNYFIKHYIFK